ncbi:MAG: SanA protein, partial [Oscillospiraceae bacterium]|nr:SanA protein [Oscillospiraceae bacterium]
MKKILKSIFIPFFILVIATVFAVFACDIYISATADKNIVGQKYVTDADCILVLGAKVNPDGTVSHALRARLETALGLYDDGVSEKII